MSGPNAVARRYTDSAMVDSVTDIFNSAAMVSIAGAIICRQTCLISNISLSRVARVSLRTQPYRRDHDAHKTRARDSRRDPPFPLLGPVKGIFRFIGVEGDEKCLIPHTSCTVGDIFRLRLILPWVGSSHV